MNRTSFSSSALPVTVIAIFCAVFTPISPSVGTPEWHVKEAPIRFKLRLWESPTHKSAGYFTQLPDGGILPTPFPLTHVVTEDGKQVASYVLWQNRSTGLALIFEDPGSAGNVYVYVIASNKLRLWSPQSGLTPSAIQCADANHGSMKAAKNLAKLGAIGPSVHYRNEAGIPDAALCIQGDFSGRPRPYSLYMLAYLVTTDPGKTWIAPFTMRGQWEVRIDNQTITPKKRIDKWGGIGQWMDLSKGLHRLDIFAACSGSGGWSEAGVMWLTWKTPNASIEELGGVRPKDVPFTGTSKWESRVLRDDEIVRSGKCRIQEINSRDGAPVAHFDLKAIESYWFGDETPLFVYDLTASSYGNPKDTQYTWSFGDVAKITGPKVLWFFRGRMEHEVALTAVSGDRESRCTVPFYAFASVQSSMNSSLTRTNFRTAFLNMMKAYPADADPTASWDKSMWDCFHEVQEFGKGYALLTEVLTKRWNLFKKKIPLEKQMVLEDIFFHWIAHHDPDKAIQWLKNQEKASPSAERRKDLKIMQAEVYMYQKGNVEEAKKILKPLAQGSGEAAIIATIRFGDVAFLEKNVNEANMYWGRVQNGIKLTTKEWEPKTLEDSRKDGKKKRTQEDEKKVFSSAAISKARVDDWKMAAVVETSMASSVISLMAQGFYMEALQELHRWERNFPISKISGDYIIQEAKFYIAIDNIRRARSLLEAYCANVDASGYLADGADLLVNCMMKDKEPDDVIKKFCEDMKKRFEFHPLAERMDALLEIISTGGVKREATIDKL